MDDVAIFPCVYPAPKNSQTIKINVRVVNRLGLHTKPSAMIFKLAQSYPDQVFLIRGKQRADAKNLHEILMLGAAPDTELTLEVKGRNAQAIVTHLQALFADKFGEE